MSIFARICPLCEKGMEEEICPEHNVPTIELSSFEDQGDSLNPGDEIEGRYRIKSLLGRGAMGAVYRAVQLSMDRDVAIKTLLKRLLTDYKLVQRFYREARAASKLDHPNIIQTYDFGIDRETKIPFIAMEYLDGHELADMLKSKGALSEEEACGILEQVSKALAEAHSKGVIHRDLKPENIWVRTLADGELQAKVLDFGIAKVLEGDEGGDEKLTGTGMTLGTPPYMSPEQIVGETVDARADLYSAGCILHELLTGKLPFSSTERRQVFLMHLNAKTPELPATLADGEPPSEGLLEFHRTLLQKNKDLRPASAKVTAKIFRALSRGKKINVSTTLTEALAEVRAKTLQVTDNTGEHVLDAAALLELSKEGTDIAIPTDPSQYVTKSLAEVRSISVGTGPAIASEDAAGVASPNEVLPSQTSSTEAPQAKKNWLPLVAGLVLVLGGVAAAALGGGGDEPVPDKDKAVASKSQTSEVVKTQQPNIGASTKSRVGTSAGSKAIVTSGKVETQSPKGLEDVPAKKGLVRVRVESEPSGAQVFEGATPLGTTPVDVRFAAGASKRLIQIKKEGFTPKEAVLLASMTKPYMAKLAAIVAKPEVPKTVKPTPPKSNVRKKRVVKRPPKKPPAKKKPKSYKSEVW